VELSAMAPAAEGADREEQEEAAGAEQAAVAGAAAAVEGRHQQPIP
jgi:hypothetical protein